jgi:hypothetical protein
MVEIKKNKCKNFRKIIFVVCLFSWVYHIENIVLLMSFVSFGFDDIHLLLAGLSVRVNTDMDVADDVDVL